MCETNLDDACIKHLQTNLNHVTFINGFCQNIDNNKIMVLALYTTPTVWVGIEVSPKSPKMGPWIEEENTTGNISNFIELKDHSSMFSTLSLVWAGDVFNPPGITGLACVCCITPIVPTPRTATILPKLQNPSHLPMQIDFGFIYPDLLLPPKYNSGENYFASLDSTEREI